MLKRLFQRVLSIAALLHFSTIWGADCVAPMPSMVAWFKGESNARDELNRGEAVVRGNPTYVPAWNGEGFHFQGGRDGIVVTNNGPLQLQQFTVEAWIRRQNSSTVSDSPGGAAIFSTGYGGYSLAMTHEGSLAVSHVGVVRVDSPQLIRDTEWHHVAATKSGDKVRMFIDGNLVHEGTQAVTYTFETPFAIGSMGQDIGGIFYSFLGDIDELSVYSGPLPDAEIQKIYAAGKAGKCPPTGNCTNPNGLLAYWAANDSALEEIQGWNAELIGDARYVDGVTGKAFRFDGKEDGVIIPDSEALHLQNFSIALWMRRGNLSITSLDFDGGALFAGGLGSYGFAIKNDGTLCISKVGITRSCTGPAVTDLDWHHVALTRNQGEVTFFMDGVQRGKAPFSEVFEFGTPFGIGGIGSLVQGVRGSFLGDIDDVAIFTRPVSEQEMAALTASRQPPVCSRDLVIQIAPAPHVVIRDSVVTYSLTLSNLGKLGTSKVSLQWPMKAGQSLVQTTFPDGACVVRNSKIECDLGDMAGGSELKADISLRFGEAGTIRNQILVASAEGDGNPLNNTIQLDTLVIDSCLPPLPGLVSRWSAEGNAWDTFGSATADFPNAAFGPGVDSGQGFFFDGKTTLPVGEFRNLRPARFTWSMWVNPTSYAGNHEMLMSHEMASGTGSHSMLAILGIGGPLYPLGTLLLNVGVPDWPNGPNTWVTAPSVIPLGEWTHVALTYETNGTAVAYVNGTAVREVKVAAQPAPSFGAQPGILTFGGTGPKSSYSHPSNRFDGSLDEIALYDRPLSPAEIAVLSQAKTGVLCRRDLAAHWIDTPGSIPKGDSQSLALAIRNGGAEIVSKPLVRLSSTAGLPILRASVNGAACPIKEGVAECSLADVSPGAESIVRVFVRADGKPGPQTITAFASSSSLDDAPKNNEAANPIEILGECRPSDNLVAWWTFEDTLAEQAQGLTDRSTAIGVFTSGRVGRAFQMGDGFVNLQTTLPGLSTDRLTVEGWIQRLEVGRSTRSSEFGALIGSDLGAWNFSLSDNGALRFGSTDISHLESNPVITDLAWHHVAVTLANGVVTLFADGEPVLTNPFAFTFQTTNTFNIGAIYAGPNQGWKNPILANLDELSVYSEALSPEQIRGIFTAGSSGKCFEDLSLQVDPQVASVNAGGSLQLRFEVSNRGNSVAPGSRLRMEVPEGYTLGKVRNPGGACTLSHGLIECDLGDLVPGAQMQIELELGTNPVATELNLDPMVTSELPDSVPTNSRASVQLAVLGPCLEAPQGLVAWWRGEGDASDFVGSNPTVTTQGGTPAFVQSRVGRGFDFNGRQGIGVTAANSLASPALTLTAWVRPTQLDGTVEIIAAHEFPTAPLLPTLALGIRGPLLPGSGNIREGQLCFQVAGVSGLPQDFGKWIDARARIPLNTWSFVSLTVDPQLHSIAVSVDGIETRRTGYSSGTPGSAVGAFYIGSHSPEASQASFDFVWDRFAGGIDELMVFRRALTLGEIQSIFSSGKQGVCPSDLGLKFVSAFTTTVPLNELFSAELQVTNKNSRPVARAVITNTLPAFFNFLSATSSLPDVLTTVRGTQLITEFGTLAPNSTASVRYFFNASQGINGHWTATLSSPSVDLDPSNNSFTLSFSTAPVELGITGNATSDGPNESLGAIEFVVRSTLVTSAPISVDYATQAGSATEGTDYIRTTGTLTLAPGQSQASILIPVINDGIAEDVETFSVTLSNARGATLKQVTGTGYIISEGSRPALSIDNVTLPEGTGTANTAVFTVTLTQPSRSSVTVQYSTANGSARAGVDYIATEGTLTFAPGETTKQVNVRTVPDGAQEPNEQFTVQLKNASGAPMDDAVGVASLLNDDGLAGQLAEFRCEILAQPTRPEDKTSIRITALDSSGNLLPNYSGAVSLSAHLGSGAPVGILLTEVYSDGNGNLLEFQNVSNSKADVSGWTVTLFDADRWPAPQISFTFPAETLINPKELLFIADRVRPLVEGIRTFNIVSNIRWTTSLLEETPRKIGVLLQDNVGRIRDAFFADGANASEVSVPVQLTARDWKGAPVPRGVWHQAMYSRGGRSQESSGAVWGWENSSLGVQNGRLILPFAEALPLSVAPEFASEFVNGVYQGQVEVIPSATGFRIFVDDGNGHTGISSPVTPPLTGDVSIELVTPATVTAGSPVEFTARIRNPGPSVVGPLNTSIQLQGNITEGAGFVASNSHGPPPTFGGSPTRWVINATVDEIRPNAVAEVRFSLISDPIQVAGSVSAIAQISKAPTDPNELNNTSESRIEIAQPPYVAPAPEIAWWPATDGARDLAGPHHGNLVGSVQIAPGRVGPGFKFTGPDAAITVPSASDLNLSPGNTLSIDFWMRTDAPDTGAKIHLFSKRDPQTGAGYSMTLRAGIPEFTLHSPLPGSQPVMTRGSRIRPLNDGQWHHIAVAMDRGGSSDRMVVLVDGVGAETVTAQAPADLSNNSPLQFGAPAMADAGQPFIGELDEITFWNRDILFTASSIFSSGSNGRRASAVGSQLVVPISMGVGSNGMELPEGVQDQPYPIHFDVRNFGPRAAYSIRMQVRFSTAPGLMLIDAGPGGSSRSLLPTLWEISLPVISPGVAAPIALRFNTHASEQFIQATLISDLPNVLLARPMALHLRFNPDTDGDGMDDDYEFAHGFNPGDPADGSQDSDGDGANNASEFRAATSPLDADSFLDIEAFQSPEGGIDLEWVAQPQRFYQIVRKLALGGADWEVIAEHIGTEIQRLRVHDVILPEGNAWYAIRVLP